jgi:hypothetical protein
MYLYLSIIYLSSIIYHLSMCLSIIYLLSIYHPSSHLSIHHLFIQLNVIHKDVFVYVYMHVL